MSDSFKGDKSKIHYKTVRFSVSESNQIKSHEDGNFGIFKGYASTYGNIDRGGDIIRKGAFVKSLHRHCEDNDRPIRMYFQHDSMFPIGGFPIDKIVDDDKGLFVEGHINLDTDKGPSVFSLMKQGVISDLSIGYSINDAIVDEDGNLNLIDVELWEISTVTEPMNTQATITDIKGATTFKDLPLADRARPWSSRDAMARVREFTGSQDSPSARYRSAFLWFDSSDSKNFGAYKLPFSDVINGNLVAVPRGIFAAAARLNQTDIPESDKKRVATHINKYYDKMGLDSPLKNSDLAEHYKVLFPSDNGEQKELLLENVSSLKEVEAYLKLQFSLSSKERKTLISKIKSFSRDAEKDLDNKRDVESKIGNEEHKKKLVQSLREIATLQKLASINQLFKGDNNDRRKSIE